LARSAPGASLTIHDPQDLASDPRNSKGWGESPAYDALRLGRHAEIGATALYRQHPGRADDKTDAIVASSSFWSPQNYSMTGV